MDNNRNIVITGASSGIGAALANHYAEKGVTLGLIGRNQERLDKVANKCRKKGADIISGLVDVTNQENMQEWLEHFDHDHPIDLIIANAGISAGTFDGVESDEQVRNIFATNVDGVLNTIQPVIPFMQQRKDGQIAIISSLAGMRGMPSAPAYSASKAAVKAYGEGLRGSLAKDGIKVNVVCPGYIRTPLTDENKFPMPFIMRAGKAAKIIAKGIDKNKSRIAFPLQLYAVIWAVNLLPVFISDKIFTALPGK